MHNLRILGVLILLIIIPALASCAQREKPAQEVSGERSNDVGEWLHKFTFKNTVMSVAFSHTSDQLFVGTIDGILHVWNVETGAKLGELTDTEAELPNPIVRLTASPTANEVLVGYFDDAARLWNIKTGKVIARLPGHEGSVRSVAFLPDGKRALTGTASGVLIRLWDLANGKVIREFKAPENPVSIAALQDGQSFLVSQFKEVKRFDIDSAECVQSYMGWKSRVKSISATRDSKQFVAGGWDGLFLRDMKASDVIGQYGDTPYPVQGITLCCDDSRILVGGTNVMDLWDVKSGELIRQFKGLKGDTEVAVSPDNRFIATGEFWYTVRIWKMPPQDSNRKTISHSERRER